MTVTISSKYLTVNGSRTRVFYSTGPWVEGVNPGTIKIRRNNGRAFPASFREVFAIENNSDSREDYFEADCIRLVPGHPLYEQVKAVA